MDSPARKRPRLASSDDEGSDSAESTRTPLRQIVAEEIDLEIALRERLVETIESKITWALLLQEQLDKSSYATSNVKDSSFEDVALDAFDAIEAPCQIIFSREPRLPPQLPLPPPPRVRPTLTTTKLIPKRKLLYIRVPNTDPASPPIVLKLACPICARTDFYALQGLLNHARLSHKLEFLSHDECVEQSAVVFSDEEREEWDRADEGGARGTEVTIEGGIPSLRRLFEIAVGGRDFDLCRAGDRDVEMEDGTRCAGTLLTRTLGHHIDTPALAQFLGRAPKRRCINVYGDEDDEIDIVSLPEAGSNLKGRNERWRMAYTHRSQARPELDVVAELPSTSVHMETSANISSAHIAGDVTSSRFHITARLVIADRSLFIHPDRRTTEKESHTYRWAISVTSPSYGLHVTTFLTSLTLTVPEGIDSEVTTPKTLSQPPFTFIGTTSVPFLAKIRMEFVGVGGDQRANTKMEVDHWVELDPLKGLTPQLGDEQVLDVELDRGTVLREENKEFHDEITWNTKSSSTSLHAPASDIPEYAKKLKAIIPKFPLTLKDVKGRLPRGSGDIPYKLCTTPAMFKGLIMGRRKAIEWRRAKAVRDAYHNSFPEGLRGDDVDLTTGDVYRWMVDEGLFPRPKIPQPVAVAAKEEPKEAQVETWCPACGFPMSVHAAKGKEGVKPKAEKPGEKLESTNNVEVKMEGASMENMWVCEIAKELEFRMPMLNVGRLLGTSRAQQPSERGREKQVSKFRPRDLVAVSDPLMTIAVRNIVHVLRLPTFTSPHDRSGLRKEEVEAHLAPYALLSIAMKSFVKTLVADGADVLMREQRDWRRRAKVGGRLLTPSHVFRGVNRSEGTMKILLGRIGVGMSAEEMGECKTEEPRGYDMGSNPVKIEEV